ncbi:MAG: hypothetical protein ACREE9_05305 [Stellaceae bacterium]
MPGTNAAFSEIRGTSTPSPPFAANDFADGRAAFPHLSALTGLHPPLMFAATSASL